MSLKWPIITIIKLQLACPHLKHYSVGGVDPQSLEEVGDRRILRSDSVQETTDKINIIKKRMIATQNRQEGMVQQ